MCDLEIVSALNQQAAELERQSAKLTERIREIAIATAPDYPGVADAEPWEQLYAIESAYTGTDAANGDLHRLIDLMRQELGWTPLEVVEFCEKSKAVAVAAEKDALALHAAVEHAKAIAAEQQSPAFISQDDDGYSVGEVEYPEGKPYGKALPSGVVVWEKGA